VAIRRRGGRAAGRGGFGISHLVERDVDLGARLQPRRLVGDDDEAVGGGQDAQEGRGAEQRRGDAAQQVLASGFPALPVVDGRERLAGIFGERELIGAIFPGYFKELGSAHFVRRELDLVLEKRAGARAEPVSRWMNSEHIDVGTDFSDAEAAETFLHHRVLLLPVTQDRRVVGVITRSAFFRVLVERFLAVGT
jgi:CBS-domain-containing membrane protein